MRKTDRLAIPLLSVLVCALLIIPACERDKNDPDPDPEIEVEEFPIKGSCPAWSPDGSKIAYLLSDSLYIINIDGNNKQKLSTVVWSTPVWSPDGIYILYTSSYGNIFRIKSDGSEKINLTNGSFYSNVPSWSPDGTKIAFVNSGLTGDLYLMNSDGSNTRKLTAQISTVSPYQLPDWTTDGNTILFSAGNEDDRDLYFIDTDGNNESRLVLNTIYEEEAQLSPDGISIFFAGFGSNNLDIYKINSDGSDLINITESIGINHHPQLSPDGTRIAFLSYRDSKDGLYLMSSDGSNLEKVFEGMAFSQVWSPDGEKIALNAFINGVSYIYIINVSK